MTNKIITISRQFGSGGRTIGHIIAQELGIPFYDKELVEHVALESGFTPNFVEEHGEHSPGKSLFSFAFAHHGVPGVMNGLSTADFLWQVQCNTILQLAEKGPCVIVGRNSDYILKDRKDAFHAYIYADMDFRAKRIVQLYGESEKSPNTRLQEKDNRRKIHYQHYTGKIWGAPENYDICLNTSTIGVEKAAQIILSLVKD